MFVLRLFPLFLLLDCAPECPPTDFFPPTFEAVPLSLVEPPKFALVLPRFPPPDLFPARLDGAESLESSFIESERSDLSLSCSFPCFFRLLLALKYKSNVIDHRIHFDSKSEMRGVGFFNAFQ